MQQKEHGHKTGTYTAVIPVVSLFLGLAGRVVAAWHMDALPAVGEAEAKMSKKKMYSQNLYHIFCDRYNYIHKPLLWYLSCLLNVWYLHLNFKRTLRNSPLPWFSWCGFQVRIISVLTGDISGGGGEPKVFLDFGGRFRGGLKVGGLEGEGNGLTGTGGIGG